MLKILSDLAVAPRSRVPRALADLRNSKGAILIIALGAVVGTIAIAKTILPNASPEHTALVAEVERLNNDIIAVELSYSKAFPREIWANRLPYPGQWLVGPNVAFMQYEIFLNDFKSKIADARSKAISAQDRGDRQITSAATAEARKLEEIKDRIVKLRTSLSTPGEMNAFTR